LYTNAHTHTHTHTTVLWPFVWDYVIEPVPEEGVIFSVLWCKRNNRGRHTDNLDGRHPIRTNQQPTSIHPHFLRRMPFLPQSFQFILAWDSQQICWLA